MGEATHDNGKSDFGKSEKAAGSAWGPIWERELLKRGDIVVMATA